MILGKFPLKKEQWIGALRVSSPWQMHEVRSLVHESPLVQLTDRTIRLIDTTPGHQ